MVINQYQGRISGAGGLDLNTTVASTDLIMVYVPLAHMAYMALPTSSGLNPSLQWATLSRRQAHSYP
uniref:Uncharacterized protein n=1 Tax=Picea glauca TaxID=3330 RepID=A0A101LXC5_PICGL|nr:hypothetical protein ABT39_MTgene6090 [Picea glauca]